MTQIPLVSEHHVSLKRKYTYTGVTGRTCLGLVHNKDTENLVTLKLWLK